MRASRCALFRGTRACLGGVGDNPYYGWSRWGLPSSYGSSWQLEFDIRHPADGTWGPTRYGGNAAPSYTEFLLDLNMGHPYIDPLYHPKLTHKQKITRLYRRCIREFQGSMTMCKPAAHLDILGFYTRQMRAEFEKHRYADEGTAEWDFVRGNEYLNSKQPPEPWSWGNWYPGHAAGGIHWARYFMKNPDGYEMFPHSFDPEEALKMQNPHHRYGMPFIPRTHLISNVGYSHNPHAFLMDVHRILNPPQFTWLWRVMLYSLVFNILFMYFTAFTWSYVTLPNHEDDCQADGDVSSLGAGFPDKPPGHNYAPGGKRGGPNMAP